MICCFDSTPDGVTGTMQGEPQQPPITTPLVNRLPITIRQLKYDMGLVTKSGIYSTHSKQIAYKLSNEQWRAVDSIHKDYGKKRPL